MARMLTIRVGELFAEVSDSTRLLTRWFLPKKTLADTLKEKLKGDDPSEIKVYSFVRGDALPKDRFIEKKLAVVVTSGFEGAFAKALTEKSLPTSHDFIFGLSERINNQGIVEKPLDQAECELISQKLRLMQVEQIIVASLHSNLNSENQNAASTFFRDNGFKVFTSPSNERDENVRWSELIEKVQWSHWVEDVEDQLADYKKSSSVKISFETYKDLKFHKPTLYVGLDNFWVASAHVSPTLLESQPSDVVEPGFFDAPEFRHFASAMRNGPLLLGKSLRPTALDLFLLDDRAVEVEGINEAQFDRMRARIEEALVTMSKGQQGTTRIDGSKVVNDSLNVFVTALNSELRRFANGDAVHIIGPLAPVVLKHLKQVDQTFRFEEGQFV